MNKLSQIKYCYHTHTFRCGHATGLDEEYVLKAIEAGIKRLGFSDHAFFPDFVQEGIRGDYSCLDDYVTSIKTLKEKYKDQIEIKLGFEAEYSIRYLPYLKKLKKDKVIDYLILGQHYSLDNLDKLSYYGTNDNNIDKLNRYVSEVIEGIESGLFSYVAHPDIYVLIMDTFTKESEEAARKILKVAEVYDIPLEINAHAFRYWEKKQKLVYPNEDFWKIASEYKIRVVIGYDAHSPNELNNELDYFLGLIKKYNLHLIEDYII